MMLRVLQAFVMKGLQISLYAEVWLVLEHLRGVPPGARFIAELGKTCGEKGMTELTGRRDVVERRNRLEIAARHKIGSAKMIPKSLGMIRIEAHRLFNPRNPIFGLSKPSQDLALLHDDKIVVRVKMERPLLVVKSLFVSLAREVARGENAMHIRVIVVELQRDLQFIV